MHQSSSNLLSIDQAEHLVRLPQTRRARSALQNLPLASVRPGRLVQLDLGPQPEQLPRVRLDNRAQALQGLLGTPVFSVTSLRSGRVSIFHKLSNRIF